jgi:hypothetical protein
MPDHATSDAALYAKATLLFKEATRIGTRYHIRQPYAPCIDLITHIHLRDGIPPSDSEFSALDQRINALTTTLPQIQSKRMLVVHTLCHVQLHRPLTSERTAPRAKQLVPARAIVDILRKVDVPKVGLIDAVLAVNQSVGNNMLGLSMVCFTVALCSSRISSLCVDATRRW